MSVLRQSGRILLPRPSLEHSGGVDNNRSTTCAGGNSHEDPSTDYPVHEAC